jgi:glutamate dehydrogenase
MVNRVGSTFVHQLVELTGATAPQVVRAYLLSREVFASVPLWQRIEALDNRVADSIQCEMIVEWRRLIARATIWFLRSKRLAEPTERGAPAADARCGPLAYPARA